MANTLRIGYAYAYYSNPVVGRGFQDLILGESYSTNGIEISADHKTIALESYPGDNNLTMVCKAVLKPTIWTKIRNLLSGQPISTPRFVTVNSKSVFPLQSVISVSFGDDWDDWSHSFQIV